MKGRAIAGLTAVAIVVTAVILGRTVSDEPITWTIVLGILAVVIVSPLSAIVSFLKGKNTGGWAGLFAIPIPALMLVLLKMWADRNPCGFEDCFARLPLVFIPVAVALMLGAMSLMSANSLARPDSRWAARWYGEERMNTARQVFEGADHVGTYRGWVCEGCGTRKSFGISECPECGSTEIRWSDGDGIHEPD
jgi:hypothetical protein